MSKFSIYFYLFLLQGILGIHNSKSVFEYGNITYTYSKINKTEPEKLPFRYSSDADDNLMRMLIE